MFDGVGHVPAGKIIDIDLNPACVSCLIMLQPTTMKVNNDTILRNGSFSKAILVHKTPAESFDAIRNFRGWWSEEIDGDTDKLNEIFFYRYKDIHLCKLQLTESVRGSRLVYRVLENEFNFIKDKTEWAGTHLIFDIVAEGAQTKVTFTHDGLTPDDECYKVCQDAWSGYIGNSLKSYIETGRGIANPKDADGFNAALAEKWRLRPQA